jgi:hypothetical protein
MRKSTIPASRLLTPVVPRTRYAGYRAIKSDGSQSTGPESVTPRRPNGRTGDSLVNNTSPLMDRAQNSSSSTRQTPRQLFAVVRPDETVAGTPASGLKRSQGIRRKPYRTTTAPNTPRAAVTPASHQYPVFWSRTKPGLRMHRQGSRESKKTGINRLGQLTSISSEDNAGNGPNGTPQISLLEEGGIDEWEAYVESGMEDKAEKLWKVLGTMGVGVVPEEDDDRPKIDTLQQQSEREERETRIPQLDRAKHGGRSVTQPVVARPSGPRMRSWTKTSSPLSPRDNSSISHIKPTPIGVSRSNSSRSTGRHENHSELGIESVIRQRMPGSPPLEPEFRPFLHPDIELALQMLRESPSSRHGVLFSQESGSGDQEYDHDSLESRTIQSQIQEEREKNGTDGLSSKLASHPLLREIMRKKRVFDKPGRPRRGKSGRTRKVIMMSKLPLSPYVGRSKTKER